MTARKLTIFTASQISTASHFSTIHVRDAANAPQMTDTSCIALTAAMRAGRTVRKVATSGTDVPIARWRIPFPANDNLALTSIL